MPEQALLKAISIVQGNFKMSPRMTLSLGVVLHRLISPMDQCRIRFSIPMCNMGESTNIGLVMVTLQRKILGSPLIRIIWERARLILMSV